jgi:hypothetical protein
MLGFFLIGHLLWCRKGLKIPGGLFITMAVSLIPLAIYSIEKWTGLWVTGEPGQYADFFSWIEGGWFPMEVATVVGGYIALKFYRFPFLMAPICFCLWFISMDVTPLIFGQAVNVGNNPYWVSMGFGAMVLIAAYLTDLSTYEDFAFWGYLFGMIAFWVALSRMESPSEFVKFLYCLINVGMILVSVFLQRSVFLIFGALGVLGYIASLFYRHFSESAWFPIVLSLVGLGVIFIGWMYHKNRQKVDAWILNLLPHRVQSYCRNRCESTPGESMLH